MSRDDSDGGSSAKEEEAVIATCLPGRLLCMLPAILPGTSLVDRLSLPRPVPAGLKGFSAVHIFWCLGQATSLQASCHESWLHGVP